MKLPSTNIKPTSVIQMEYVLFYSIAICIMGGVEGSDVKCVCVCVCVT